MHVCYLYGLPAIPTVMQRARLPDDAMMPYGTRKRPYLLCLTTSLR